MINTGTLISGTFMPPIMALFKQAMTPCIVLMALMLAAYYMRRSIKQAIDAEKKVAAGTHYYYNSKQYGRQLIAYTPEQKRRADSRKRKKDAQEAAAKQARDASRGRYNYPSAREQSSYRHNERVTLHQPHSRAQL